MPSGAKKVFITKLTDISLSDKEGVGTLRFEGNKIYKYCKILNTTGTVAGVAGDLVAYTGGTALGVKNHEVCLDLSDADAKPVPAGTIGAAVVGTLLVPEYGWVQIKGPVLLAQTVLDTPADGGAIALSATDKTATMLDYAGTTPNIQPVFNYCGILNDASAKEAVLDCPF